MDVSEAQQHLDAGRYVIVTFAGYWYSLLPPGSPWAELLGDTIFRTGFADDVPEERVREFYATRLQIQPDEIKRVIGK